jgi:hypothetical protein
MQRGTQGVLRGSRGTRGAQGVLRGSRGTSDRIASHHVLWRQRFVWLKGHSTGKIVVHALPNVPPLPSFATPDTTLHHRTTRCITAQHVSSPHNTLHHRTTRCITAQHVASPHNTFHHRTTRFITAQHVSSPHNTLHHRTARSSEPNLGGPGGLGRGPPQHRTPRCNGALMRYLTCGITSHRRVRELACVRARAFMCMSVGACVLARSRARRREHACEQHSCRKHAALRCAALRCVGSALA